MSIRDGIGVLQIVDRDRYAPGMARQLAAFRAAVAAGTPRIGWKVGINAPRVLQSLGLRHSGVGWIDGQCVLSSGDEFTPASGARIRVEPELCIHLNGAVPASLDVASAGARVAAVSPAIEIVDYAKSADGLDAVVGHSMFHAAVVLGGRAPWTTPPGLGSTLPVLQVDGELGPLPGEDLVPSDLGGLLAFVAAFLEEFGEALGGDDIVLTGSYTERAVAVASGNQVRADFGPLGSVQVRIGGEAGRD